MRHRKEATQKFKYRSTFHTGSCTTRRTTTDSSPPIPDGRTRLYRQSEMGRQHSSDDRRSGMHSDGIVAAPLLPKPCRISSPPSGLAVGR